MSSRTVVACVLVVGLISLAWMAGGRGTAQRTSGAHASDDGQRPDAAKCQAMWTNGVEVQGQVGERATYAYFDMADLNGSRDRVSGS